MARQDKNKHRPRHLRERNPTASLECWERRQMAMEDRNEHRPKKLQQKNPTRHLVLAERRRMAMEDKNRHRPKKTATEDTEVGFAEVHFRVRFVKAFVLSEKTACEMGIHAEQESQKLLDQQRQRVLRQRKAQHKKDQDELEASGSFEAEATARRRTIEKRTASQENEI